MDEEVKNNFTSAPIFNFVVLGNLVTLQEPNIILTDSYKCNVTSTNSVTDEAHKINHQFNCNL